VADLDIDAAVVGYAAGLRFEDLPAATRARTKLLVLDTVGAALAAIGADGVSALEGLMRRWGGAPEAGVLGYGTRGPAHQAALVNAALARALELDDVHETALVHATATMVPVALAVAEQVGGVDGRDFLTAVAMGVDLACRLSMAPLISLGGDDYQPRAMSYTYQTGTLAGSLVAARLAGLGRPGLTDAFGNAYSQCAGNLQGLAEGSLMVRVQQGLAASSAVLAMELAREGVGGIHQPLHGIYGWFQAFYGGRYDAAMLLDGLGERFEGDQVSIKPYACCKYGHNAIAAAVEITGDPDFALDHIEAVSVTVASRDCWDLICAPLELKADPAALAGPDGWALAQFSLPFMVACALARGGLTVADLEPEARADPRVAAVLRVLHLEVDDQTRAKTELPEPGHVTVRLRGGRTLERTVTRALGHPDRPMSPDEQMAKFRWCTERLDPAAAGRLGEMLLSLEDLGDAGEIVRLSAAAGAGLLATNR
jgi:2-methylcitrate dehydratase PrpD